MKERRYKLWWSGKGDGVGGVGAIAKEELRVKVVEVKRVSDRVMTLVVVFEENVLRLICGNAPQSGRCFDEKVFYDDLKCDWDMHSAESLAMCLDDFNGHIGRGAWRIWCRSEEFGRKNAIRALSGEGIMCVKHMV